MLTSADMADRALTRRETALRLGISMPTLRRIEQDGGLHPRSVTPGRVVHLESEVVEFLRSRPTEPLRERTAAARAARLAKARGQSEAA
jgi:predicted DNA-binding transcriptional regulator AlpA